MNKQQAIDYAEYLRAMGALGVSREEADTVRRAALTMQRWHDAECGQSGDHDSWRTMWNDNDGKPYVEHVEFTGDGRASYTYIRIADRYTPARARVEAVAKRHGLTVHIQSDPRGAPVRFHTDRGMVIPPRAFSN